MKWQRRMPQARTQESSCETRHTREGANVRVLTTSSMRGPCRTRSMIARHVSSIALHVARAK